MEEKSFLKNVHRVVLIIKFKGKISFFLFCSEKNEKYILLASLGEKMPFLIKDCNQTSQKYIMTSHIGYF